jgi:predicted DsbA family dithiol-disulfide isomerase
MELPPEYQDETDDSHMRLKKMAESGGLKITFTGRIPNSRLALEATEYAYAQGRGDEFHRAVFDKLYGEGRDIGSWEVLRAAANESGLKAAELEKAITGGEYSAVLDKKLVQAADLGIKAVPTYVINGKYRIVGAQPFTVFEEAIAGLGV